MTQSTASLTCPNKLKEDRLLHNISRIPKLNIVYIGFIYWTMISNLISVYILDSEVIYPRVFTLLYSSFLIFNIASFIFIQFFLMKGKLKLPLAIQEKLVYFTITLSIFWGAAVSLLDQQIYMHLLVFTFSILFCAAFFYIPIKFVVSITLSSSIMLIFGVLFLQPDALVTSILILFIVSIDIVTIMLSITIYKTYEASFIATEKLHQEYEKTQALTKQLEFEANFDLLTQMFNRRGFKNYIEEILTKDHVRKTMTAFVIDIDYFKQYNDIYGHAKGDIVLHNVAKKIMQIANEHGFITARWGGEEFIAISQQKNLQDNQLVCIALCQEIEQLAIPHEGSDISAYITISIGSSTAQCANFDDIEALMDQADKALYQVKKQGRNHHIHI